MENGHTKGPCFRVRDAATGKPLPRTTVSLDLERLGRTDAQGELRVGGSWIDAAIGGYHYVVAFHSFRYKPHFLRIASPVLNGVEAVVEIGMEPSPDPPQGGVGWGLQAIRGPWDAGKIRRPVRVGVLDVGVDRGHPCLKVVDGVSVCAGKRRGRGPGVGWSHGTACAGIIGGFLRHGQGVLGVVPGTELADIDVFDGRTLDAPSWAIRDGVQWAIDHGVDVINLGIGSPRPQAEEENAYRRAWEAGIVLVAPTGNTDIPGQSVLFPAAYPYTIAVTAIGRAEDKSLDPQSAVDRTGRWFFPTFNCCGPEVDLAAPGVEICSVVPVLEDGQIYYESGSGTSEAASFVTGAAAAVLAAHPELTRALGPETPETVRRMLRSAAVPMGFNSQWEGAGLLGLGGIPW